MKDNFLAIGAISIIIFSIFYAGSLAGEKALRDKACAAGVAHYTVNPISGLTKFEWLTNDSITVGH